MRWCGMNCMQNIRLHPTAEEREQARQEYLDKRGIFADFRW